jgi:hypothetical protein
MADYNSDVQQSLRSMGRLEGNVSITNRENELTLTLRVDHRKYIIGFVDFPAGISFIVEMSGSRDNITFYQTIKVRSKSRNFVLRMGNAFPYVRIFVEPADDVEGTIILTASPKLILL